LTQLGAGRSQLRSKAGHTSAVRSLSQPGSSDQLAGTHLARGRTTTSPGVVRPSSPEGSSACAGAATGGLEHPASAPKMKKTHTRNRVMWLLVLEAVGAAALLVLIVWWTMFSGRRRGELESDAQEAEASDQPDLPR
jgi:hypothetical protein